MQQIGGEYLDQFRKNRELVLKYLDDSIGILREWELPTEADPLRRLRENVSNGIFSIVMVGEFSAGKSTFLNALMHKRILPSFSSETTATINRLRHIDFAPEPGVHGVVHYLDGTEKSLPELSVDALGNVVSTRGDSQESKIAATVRYVDLFLDSDFLKEGVMLVDSPGLNSNSDLHRDVTEKQIKESHASIVVFNASQPGSKSNFEFLRDLKAKQNSDNIFYLLNRIDDVKPSEETVDDVIKNIQENYRKEFPNEKAPKIWPVSASFALSARDLNAPEYRPGQFANTQEKREQLEQDSRMAKFEERLWRYLTQGERTRSELTAPIEKTTKLFRARQDEFKVRVSVLEQETSSAELREKKEALEREISELKKNRKNLSGDMKKEVELLLSENKEKARSQCAALLTQAKSQLEPLDTPDEISDSVGELNRFIRNQLQRIAGTLDNDLRTGILEIIGTEYEDFVSALEDRLPESEGYSSLHLTERDIIVKELSTGVNLEQFTRDCEELEAQIKAHEEQLNQAHNNKLKARRLEREREECCEELKSLRQSVQYLNDNFILPDVHYHMGKQDIEHERRGLFGKIAKFFVGNKTEMIDVPVADSTARDEERARFDKQQAKLEGYIAQAQKRLDEIPRSDGHSDEYEAECQHLTSQIQMWEAQLLQKQSDFREKMKAASDKVCRRMRQSIINQVDSLQQETADTLCAHLRDQERQCIRAAQDMLNAALEQELQTLQRKLDDIISDLEKDGEDRDQMIENLKGKISAATILIRRGVELLEFFDESLKDHIEKGED